MLIDFLKIICFFQKMTDKRDPRLNKILDLLSQVSGDKSLEFMSNMCDPKLIQESYRKLWRLYSEPKLVSLLHFELGYIAKRNRKCNTWVAQESVTERKDILCSVCGKKSDLFIQIDTSDMFFTERKDTYIFHIYTCEAGHEFNVLLSDKEKNLSNEELETTWSIRSFEAGQDKPEVELNVLIPDKSKCIDCPVDTPFKIKPITLKIIQKSKCGGYSSHRQFVPSTKVHQGKAKIFKDGDIVKLHINTTICSSVEVGCTCFYEEAGIQILYLSSVEIPAFDNKSISELRLFECEECKVINTVIYSQKLNLSYSDVILEVEDRLYHILRSEDKMHGVVISVKKREHEVLAICFLENFEYREGYKNCIKYKKVESLLPIHYSMLEDLHISTGDNATKFKKFIRNYEGDPEGKEDEEDVLDVIKDEKVILHFGENFSRVGKGTVLEDCLLYHKDDELIVYGNLVAKHTGFKVTPLSGEQKKCANNMSITIGNIADLE